MANNIKRTSGITSESLEDLDKASLLSKLLGKRVLTNASSPTESSFQNRQYFNNRRDTEPACFEAITSGRVPTRSAEKEIRSAKAFVSQCLEKSKSNCAEFEKQIRLTRSELQKSRLSSEQLRNLLTESDEMILKLIEDNSNLNYLLTEHINVSQDLSAKVSALEKKLSTTQAQLEEKTHLLLEKIRNQPDILKLEKKVQDLGRENKALKEERKKLREFNCKLNQALSEVGRNAELIQRDLNLKNRNKASNNETQRNTQEILNTENYVVLQTSPGKSSLTEFNIMDSNDFQMQDSYFMSFDDRALSNRKVQPQKATTPFLPSPNQSVSTQGKENAILTDSSVNYGCPTKNRGNFPTIIAENDGDNMEELEGSQEIRLDSECDQRATKFTSNELSFYHTSLNTNTLCSPKSGNYNRTQHSPPAKETLKQIVLVNSGYYSYKKAKKRPSTSSNKSMTLSRLSVSNNQCFKSTDGSRIFEDMKLHFSASKNSPKHIF